MKELTYEHFEILAFILSLSPLLQVYQYQYVMHIRNYYSSSLNKIKLSLAIQAQKWVGWTSSC